MKEQLQAIVTVLSLVNPAICAAMFAQAAAGRSLGEKMTDATKAGVAILVILSVAALIGTQLLHLFGVSLDAFMVAGGGVLAWMGFSMLSRQPDAPDPAADDSSSTQSLTPLIMFAASPGTITGVITLSAAHTRLKLPITALVAIAVATACTWLVMLLVARFGGKQGGGGFLRDTLTRFMGLIVLSMGIQFALTGFHAFGTGAGGGG
jgi:multiple antibiotic resistance protein